MTSDITIFLDDIPDEVGDEKSLTLTVANAVVLRDALIALLDVKVGEAQ